MAVIIGRTPAWGADPAAGTLSTALIITGIDYSSTIKEAEFSDENGQTCGWRAYDQQTEVTISGNPVYQEGETTDIDYTQLKPATILDAATGGVSFSALTAMANTQLISDASVLSVVAKSPSFSRTNEGAASLTIPATCYYFA